MTAIPLDHAPLPCTTKAGRQLASFLIDSRSNATRGLVLALTRDHLDMCAGRKRDGAKPAIAPCPIKAACWGERADEDWVQRLQVEEQAREKAGRA